MSLPPAQKDISTNPAKGSVVEPVDNAKKERDVERKLKVYNAIQALRSSHLPSNKQFDSLLKYFQTNINDAKGQKNLSKDTEKLFADLNVIIDSIRDEVQDKNGDELIQDLIWRTRPSDIASQVSDGVNQTGKEATLPVEKEKAQQDANTAVQHIRTLLNLILTNSEARKLVSDFSLVGRDLLARGAAKAAGAIAPSDEQLARVDESHRGDQFVEQDVIADAQRKKDQAAQQKEAVKSEAKETARDPAIQTEVLQAARPGEQPTGTGPYATTTVGGGATAEPGASPYTDTQGGSAVEEKKKGFLENLRSRIPDQHKDRAQDQYQRGKEFLTEEYFPKERRDQWIYRAKKVIIECQGHQDYQDSLNWLIGFVEEYFGHGRTLAEQHGKNGADRLKETDLTTTLSSVRVLMDRFANGKPFDSLVLDRLNALADDAQRDQELRDWWSRVDSYIRKILLTPGYITEPASETDGRKLLDEGHQFYGTANHEADATEAGIAPRQQGKYTEHFNRVFDGVGEWVRGIGEDPKNKQFGESLTRFTKDLMYVEDGEGGGKLTFKREMWGDIRRVVIPMLVDRVGYIPIPRIEYTDDALDLVVENLTLSGRNLFPNIVSVEAHNYLRFSPYSAINKKDDESRHEFIITLSQMQADIRDVAFYFRRKSGFPKIKDSGLADVVVGGEGLNVTIHVSTAKNDPSSFISVKNVNVKIDSLKFSIRDSKHETLYKILKPLATGLVKRQIAKAIRDAIETGLGFVDGQLVAVRDRMNEADARKDGEGAEGSQGRMAALGEMFKRTKTRDDNASVSSSQTHSQFKVVSNKRNSILAKEGHPAGWVNRAVDKSDFEGGDKTAQGAWKTEAFDIENLTTGHPDSRPTTHNAKVAQA